MKNQRHTAAQQTPKELLAELQTLVADAEKMVTESAGEATEGVMESLRSRYEAMQERLSELYDGARRKVSSGVRYTDTTIRENPYQALAVAAGIGLLVGVLLGRRTKD